MGKIDSGSSSYEDSIMNALEAAGFDTKDRQTLFEKINLWASEQPMSFFDPREFDDIDCRCSVTISTEFKGAGEEGEPKPILMVDVRFNPLEDHIKATGNQDESYAVTFEIDPDTFTVIKADTEHAFPNFTEVDTRSANAALKAVYEETSKSEVPLSAKDQLLMAEDAHPGTVMQILRAKRNSEVPSYVKRSDGKPLTHSEVTGEPFLMKAIEAFTQKNRPM